MSNEDIFDMGDLDTVVVEDLLYYPALKRGETAMARETNHELYERVRNEHNAQIDERSRRLNLDYVPGERIKATLFHVKELSEIMRDLKQKGREIADKDPRYDFNNDKEEI